METRHWLSKGLLCKNQTIRNSSNVNETEPPNHQSSKPRISNPNQRNKKKSPQPKDGKDPNEKLHDGIKHHPH